MSRILILLFLALSLTTCRDVPTRPGSSNVPPAGLGPSADVAPSSSSLQMTALANSVSDEISDASTVTDTDSDAQSGTTDPLAISVTAVSGDGTLQATGTASVGPFDPDSGDVYWSVGWVADGVPGTDGSRVGVSAIGSGDGWIYSFTADRTGSFSLYFNVSATGSNTFGLNPFNFEWYEPGSPLPTTSQMAIGTTGTIEYPIVAGNAYTARITNNSGLAATGAISDRDAQLNGSFSWEITATIFTVTNTNDAGPGSLRQAIYDANFDPGLDTIQFNIPATDPGCDATSEVCTIQPDFFLPEVTDSLLIDGFTQPGAIWGSSPNSTILKIELDGSAAGGGGTGLGIGASGSGSTIRGLVINRFSNTGILLLSGATNNVIAGNFIGTDAAGNVAVSGPLPMLRGVYLSAAPDNTIEGNLISGNQDDGVEIVGPGASGNEVAGNFIGTNASGSSALGNGTGIRIYVASGNTVTQNTISGNTGHGVEISYSTDNTFWRNRIGTDTLGVIPVGNSGSGVFISSYSGDNTIGNANTIAFNGEDGVTVVGSGTGNAIYLNSIHSNTDLGIDLGGDGVTPNDPGDGDVGPNNLQNYPVVESAVATAGGTTISGTLNSVPNETFTIGVYSNGDDLSVPAEGRDSLPETVVMTDGTGQVSFDVTIPFALALGELVTTTATDAAGNTSEFSVGRAVVSDGTIYVTVTNQGDPVPGHVVTVVNNATGPFRTNGSVTMAVSGSDGKATISGLTLPGDYCVHVRPLTSVVDATAFGTYIVPPGDQEPQQPKTRAAGIWQSSTNTLDFTSSNYQQLCVDNPAISLDGVDNSVDVTVVLQPPENAATVQVAFEDLEGNAAGLPGWVVIEKSLPWFPAGLDPDVVPGLLMSAAPPVGEDGIVTITGLTPYEDVILTSGIQEVADLGALTYTVEIPAQDLVPDATLELGDVVAEPQMCAVERKDEATGDATPAGIDILGPVKDGYRADAQLNRLEEVAIFYDEAGYGRGKLIVMFRRGLDEALSLVAHYRCRRNAGCYLEGQNGTAYDAGTRADLFFAADEGGGRITWSITSLPALYTQIEYMLLGTGDVFPGAGFTPILNPTACTGGLSNDPRWWIAG